MMETEQNLHNYYKGGFEQYVTVQVRQSPDSCFCTTYQTWLILSKSDR